MVERADSHAGYAPSFKLTLDPDELPYLDRVQTLLGPRTSRHKAIVWALRTAGQGASALTLADLDGRARALRETLRGVAALDLVPHPCPPQVDPKWWREQQAIHHAATMDQLVVAVERADRQAAELIAVLATAKKGDAQ